MNPVRALRRIAFAKETGLLVVIAVLALLLTWQGGTVTHKVRDADGRVTGEVTVNKFLQPANIDSVLKNSSWIAVMAIGATVLIISGGIDLSIGSIYCLAAVTGGLFFRWLGPTGAHATASPVWVIPAGILITMLVGAGCGAANGAMVVVLRVHPFIITLGTMSIFRGLAFVATEAQSITDYPPGLGETFRRTIGEYAFMHDFITSRLGEFTLIPILIVLLVTAAGYFFLSHLVPGREAYAIGGNETASRFSGIRIGRIKLLVYTLAGLCGGIAAVIGLGVFGAADSASGSGYELDVIAAAVVGGASLTGGRGTALGALLGALVIQLINNGMVVLDIDSNYESIIKGSVIIIAVVLDRLTARLGQGRAVATG